jgi:hypothetical protein
MTAIMNALALAIAVVVALSVDAAEQPTLTIPRQAASERYATIANVSVDANLDPPMPIRAELKVFHVTEDGEHILQGRMTAPFDPEGCARFSYYPPAEGWPAGTLLCVVTPIGYPDRKQSFNMNVVDIGVPVAPYREPKHSGIIIDLASRTEQDLRVIAGELFDIRGNIVWQLPPDRLLGPLVRTKIIHRRNGREVICGTGSVPALREGDITCSFEMEVRAPEVSREYVLQMQYPVQNGDQERDYQLIEMPLTVDVRNEPD